MIDNLLVIPILLPLLVAALCALLRPSLSAQRAMTAALAVLLLAASGWLLYHTLIQAQILTLRVGNWAPGVGIVWVADTLSSLFLLLSSLVLLAAVWAFPAGIDRLERRFFFPLLNLIMVGINGAFLTGDLFNLFVFFEVMLVASFVLISQGRPLERLRQAFPYVVINLLASAIFLLAVGVIYATSGTVTMAGLAVKLGEQALGGAFWGAAFMVVLVFCIKAGLVPWHFWLPDAYPQSSIPVNAFFAGLLTKVGIYALYRFVPILSRTELPLLYDSLLVISLLTMVVGVFGALGRASFREILSFHIVSQVGYMVFGLGLGSEAAMAGGLFYILHHIIVKAALFFAVGIPELRSKSGKLGVARGVAAIDPASAVAFLVPALALAGLPPLSGFWGKFFLAAAGFQKGAWLATSIAIAVSLFTLASMLKIWNASYWGSAEGAPWHREPYAHRLKASALMLAALSVGVGLAAGPVFSAFQRLAADILSAERYINAVVSAGLISG